jgi:NAD(P)H dehydrogenase (quinone)
MNGQRSAKVLVCFYSRFGSTAALADAIADGASILPRDQVLVRRVPELESEDVIRLDPRWWQAYTALQQRYHTPQRADFYWADALVIGSPGYFGAPAAALQHWLERTVSTWRPGEIEEKAGAAFCTTGTLHGGNEQTILSMLTGLMHLGFVIVPAGYLYPVLSTNQSPYGASAATGPNDDVPPTEADLAAARALGFRVSHVARCLVAGREEEGYRRRRTSWASAHGPTSAP